MADPERRPAAEAGDVSWKERSRQILLRAAERGESGAVEALEHRNFFRGYQEASRPGQTAEGFATWFREEVDGECVGLVRAKNKALIGASRAITAEASSLSSAVIRVEREGLLDRNSDAKGRPKGI